MHSSVMNALFKLLLSQRNKSNCLKGLGRGGGGERLPEKVVTDVLARVLGFTEINFCLGIRLQEVTFATHKVFGDFFLNEKMHNI